MKFGEFPLDAAEGIVLAHSRSIELDGRRKKLPKGSRLTAAHVAALRAEGAVSIMGARLDPDDVPEDEAAGRLAEAAAGACVRAAAPFTGRANLVAESGGLVLVDSARIDAVNAIHESLTIATLRPFEDVAEGQMLATVKVIPFAAPRPALQEAMERLGGGAVSVAPFAPRKVGLLSTVLPGRKPSLLDKTRKVMEGRCEKSGSTIVAERRTPHTIAAVAEGLAELKAEGADLLVAFSASAVVDRADVVPAGLVAAGGSLIHLGMPVDPGNLLLVGVLGGVPAIGAPSCARTPKLNGFDWVFDRMVAGLPVEPADIAGMGVGGLLKEIASRPQPREGLKAAAGRRSARVAAVLLAAGQSRRMGARNKLTVSFQGKPMVRWAAEAAAASAAGELVVVTGHQPEAVREALAGLDARFVHNSAYADGLSTSIASGLAALGDAADGVLVMLGDMPRVSASDVDRLIAAFDPEEGRSIVVPTFDGKRGNPVLWGREFFPTLAGLQGDVGARHLIGEHSEVVAEVELGDSVLSDIDTEAALAAAEASAAE